jgi:hypothetical protein
MEIRAATVAAGVLAAFGAATSSFAHADRTCTAAAHRGALRTDVDRDGRADAVAVRHIAGSACSFRLVAELASGVRLDVRLPRAGGGELWPRLIAIIRLGPGAREAIVVSSGQGASTTMVQLYAVRGAHLVRLGGRRDSFASGASGVASAVDCIHDPHYAVAVISSFAESSVDGWTVTRRTYGLRSGVFRLERTRRLTKVQGLPRLPEFRGSGLFPSCTIARVTL